MLSGHTTEQSSCSQMFLTLSGWKLFPALPLLLSFCAALQNVLLSVTDFIADLNRLCRLRVAGYVYTATCGSYFNNLERIFTISHCFCFVFLTHLLHQDSVLSGFSLSSGSKPRSLTCSMLDSLVARVAYDGGFSSFLVNLASKDFKCFIELYDRKKINLAAEFKWQPNSEYEILNWYGQNKNAAHYIA